MVMSLNFMHYQCPCPVTSYCLNKMNLMKFSHNMKMEALIHVLELKMMESASQLNFDRLQNTEILSGPKYIYNVYKGIMN